MIIQRLSNLFSSFLSWELDAYGTQSTQIGKCNEKHKEISNSEKINSCTNILIPFFNVVIIITKSTRSNNTGTSINQRGIIDIFLVLQKRKTGPNYVEGNISYLSKLMMPNVFKWLKYTISLFITIISPGLDTLVYF